MVIGNYLMIAMSLLYIKQMLLHMGKCLHFVLSTIPWRINREAAHGVVAEVAKKLVPSQVEDEVPVTAEKEAKEARKKRSFHKKKYKMIMLQLRKKNKISKPRQ